MRLRNVKNKDEILSSSSKFISNPSKYKGKWHDLFGNDNPIYIEIGMGKGKFIIENAIENPNINYIGIEKYDSILAKALQKLDKNISNLYIIRLDALFIDDVFDHEIDCIFLNFSDPWPKKRHQLRRLSSPIFLEKYDSIFKDNKLIEMRTDNSSLFSYSLVSFSAFNYKLVEVSLNFHEDYDVPITTEYEDKFSNNGQPIFYVKCMKE